MWSVMQYDMRRSEGVFVRGVVPMAQQGHTWPCTVKVRGIHSRTRGVVVWHSLLPEVEERSRRYWRGKSPRQGSALATYSFTRFSNASH